MRLEDVCKVFTDGDWIESKDQSNEGIRLVQTGNIGEGKYLEKADRAKYISEETFDVLKCTEIFPGDILVSRLPEPVGRACIIPEKEERMITAVDCTICRPDENVVLKEYLCYFMQSEAYYTRLMNNVTGTTRKRISRKNLGNVELNIPNKAIQVAVVEKLDILSRVIDGRKEELEKLDELIKARFVELFGYHADNNMTLEECCSNITGGGTPSMQHPEFYGGNIPFIKSGDVKGTQVTEGALWLTEEALNRGKTKLIPKGSIVVVVRSAALLHKFSIAVSANDLVINQDLKALTPSKDFLPEFLMWSIKSQEQILLGKVQTMLTSHIRIEDLLGLKVHKASMGEQIAFVDFLRQVDKSKVAVQKSLEETQKLFDSLMQEYFG